EEREVRDHRREVGAAIFEELVYELAPADPHGGRVCTLIPSERWTRPPLSPISSRFRRRSRRPPCWPKAAYLPARWASRRRVRVCSPGRCATASTALPLSAATSAVSPRFAPSSPTATCSLWPRASRRSSRLHAGGSRRVSSSTT